MRWHVTCCTRGMAKLRADESWTIPLHVLMWTTFTVGLIMVMAVFLMRR